MPLQITPGQSAPPPSTLDISQVSGDATLTVKPAEKDDERTSRLEIAKADAAQKRLMDSVRVFASLGLVAGIVVFSASVVAFASEVELRKLAFGLLTTVVASALSYLAGKASKTG